jgi:hypothetical protein
MRVDRLFQLKRLHAIASPSVDIGHNEAMQGVGIVLGIVDDLP